MKNKLIPILVLSLLILSLSFCSASFLENVWSKITGNFIADNVSCYDSDGGINFYVKGEGIGKPNLTYTYYDFCVENQNSEGPTPLIDEYYCNNNSELYHVATACPNGTICKNGACSAEKLNCSQIGGKICKNLYAGSCDGYFITTNDSRMNNICCLGKCLTEEIVNENSCENLNRPENFCILRGKNYAGDIYKVDSCETNSNPDCRLISYVCKKGSFVEDLILCPKGCKDGTCISASNNSKKETIIDPTCTDSDNYAGNHYIRGYTSGISDEGSIWNKIDSCIDDIHLEEFNCNMKGNREIIVCPNGCSDGACIYVEEGKKPEAIDFNETITLPEVIEPYEVKCNGCELDGKCYSFGYRKTENFCSDLNNQFIAQKQENINCENNFECSSNVCVSGKCISEGFIQSIINWFKRLFGAE